jgi:hypothetical protein
MSSLKALERPVPVLSNFMHRLAAVVQYVGNILLEYSL